MGKKILKNVMIACLMVISFTVHIQKVEAFEFGRGENNISQELYKIGSIDTEDDEREAWYNEEMRKVFGDIRSPYGYYYTTPWCEESEEYYGSELGDTLYICIYPAANNGIYVAIQSLFGDDLYASVENPAELYFDPDEGKWLGDDGASLERDEESYHYIYTDSSLRICLEKFGTGSAWAGPIHAWGDIHPEGVYTSADGTYSITVVDLYNRFFDIILSGEDVLLAEMDLDTNDTYDVYLSGRQKILEMTCSDVTEDTVETLTFTDPDTGVSADYYKDSSVYDLYLNAGDFSGKYKITGGLAGDDSYLTLEYRPDARYYTYQLVWQGEEIIPMGVGFPANISQIQSEAFCMSLAPYINGEEEYIETAIPRFGENFYLYPEE